MKTLGDSLRHHPQDLLLTLPGEFDDVLHSGCCAYVEVGDDSINFKDIEEPTTDLFD